MKQYFIVQLCCISCKKFINLYSTDDYIDFITDLPDYNDFTYYIYNSNFELISILEGDDL